MSSLNADHIITRALGLLGVYGAGETINGDEMTDCLAALNEMLDSWQTERRFVYTVQELTHTLTAGTSSMTIGPSQTLNVVDRPVMLDDWSYVVDSTNNPATPVSYRVRKINGEQFSSISVKALTSTYPNYLYYDGNYPNGVIQFWPVPTLTTTLHLRLQKLLAQFADLSTDYDFPPGYQRAITYSLMEELSSVYGRIPSPTSVEIASKARANIKRINGDTNVMSMPSAIMRRRMGGFNIYSGE